MSPFKFKILDKRQEQTNLLYSSLLLPSILLVSTTTTHWVLTSSRSTRATILTTLCVVRWSNPVCTTAMPSRTGHIRSSPSLWRIRSAAVTSSALIISSALVSAGRVPVWTRRTTWLPIEVVAGSSRYLWRCVVSGMVCTTRPVWSSVRLATVL